MHVSSFSRAAHGSYVWQVAKSPPGAHNLPVGSVWQMVHTAAGMQAIEQASSPPPVRSEHVLARVEGAAGGALSVGGPPGAAVAPVLPPEEALLLRAAHASHDWHEA